ncbi:MAG: alpha/beta hydrolase [Gammaproteobacteria bacterium]
MPVLSRMLLAALVLAISGGCVVDVRRSYSAATALRLDALRTQGYSRVDVDTPVGPLRVWQRGLAGAERVHVYIEGDGRAWLTRYRASTDPTPRRPVALELALHDATSAVLYVARPCQYVGRDELRACDPRYWTSHRYAEAVIAAIDTVVDELLAPISPRPRIGLIGFSGGAVVAALLAARRSDIAWLVHVAGNLDVAAWTRQHGVSALDDSLDPLDSAARLAHLPQVLLLGAQDPIVPPDVLDAYIAAAGRKLSVRVFAGFDHSCCWATVWPGAACEMLSAAGVDVGGLCSTP